MGSPQKIDPVFFGIFVGWDGIIVLSRDASEKGVHARFSDLLQSVDSIAAACNDCNPSILDVLISVRVEADLVLNGILECLVEFMDSAAGGSPKDTYQSSIISEKWFLRIYSQGP